MDAATKQFISDASLRLMGMSDRTLNEYIAAIGTFRLSAMTVSFLS